MSLAHNEKAANVFTFAAALFKYLADRRAPGTSGPPPRHEDSRPQWSPGA